ncbi:Protoporphyrinogen oxidase [Legionella lansingensis]|uniref:FAD dependent oxidoreductase domain-containing protein n=1 Tax=Legionella lansingensis TaxID=45067 RepID=A0A0W0VTT7_9GAMM|nr:FAD-dependent oxidoreductase [Legionella lansingensis]KTD23575.1 hypothetical protein Llan_0710 [Legionella lansingensis]SNV52311.1 Protoporphyrinogen oxidase [Legionella lansingensis]
MKIAIIGAGWYGCHLALELKKAGYDVTLYEKKEDILLGTSGDFSIRLHVGAHYLRSEATQDSCQKDKASFSQAYPEFIVPHEYSIYALGQYDALGHPSRVDQPEFERVCHRFPTCEEVELDKYGFKEVDTAFNFDEPSLVIGDRLRNLMKDKLKQAGINVVCNHPVSNLSSNPDGVILTGKDGAEINYDYAINTTGFQALVPDITDKFPVPMEVVYQPCLGLKYRDTKPQGKPISFIVMDGFFPCVMPCIEDDPFKNTYILTNGAYTILNSCKTPEEAYAVLNQLTDDFVKTKINTRSQDEMKRFWPEFGQRFEYEGWKGAVLAKIRTKTEFRSAVTFAKDRVIYMIPGKISNVMSVGPEVQALLEDSHCLTENGIRFVRGGVLDGARTEIMTKPTLNEPNTCNLQTYDTLKTETGKREKGETKIGTKVRPDELGTPPRTLKPEESATLVDADGPKTSKMETNTKRQDDGRDDDLNPPRTLKRERTPSTPYSFFSCCSSNANKVRPLLKQREHMKGIEPVRSFPTAQC